MVAPRRLLLTAILSLALTSFCHFASPCLAQENPTAATEPQVEPADCPPLSSFPPLVTAVVVSCQKGDSVGVTMPMKTDAQGRIQEKTIRGNYEFREYRITRVDQQERAFDNLMQLIPMAGFIVKYSSRPSIITARNSDTWILIRVSGDSYNISVVRDSQPCGARLSHAEEISREMEAHNRVTIYGIQFSPVNQAIQEKNSEVLNELLKYLKQNPTLSLVIESHKVSIKGTDEDDFEITRERANAVVDWLVAHGVPPGRLQAKPVGRMRPLTENDTPMEIECNDRIELSKTVK